MKICFLILLCSFCFVGHTQVEYNKKKTWNYPLIKPDTVIEDFYGSKIIDPYRNLENLEDSLVKNWYMNQKQFYDSILLNISNRDSLEKKLNNLKKQRKYWAEIPRMVDKKLFFSRYCYETETYCLDYMNSISDTIHTLFSLDSMNKADNVKYRLDYFEPSHDGNLIAIALSAQGKENSSIYILNVKNKVLLPDIIQNAMGGNPQWLPDNSGFFYQQYIKNNNPDGSKKRKKCVNIHHIGKSPKDDKEIFSKEVSKQIEVHEIDFPLIFLSQSSNNVLGALNHGTEGYSTLYYASLDDVLNSSPEKINWQQIFQHQDLVTNYYLKDDNIFY